MSPEHSPQKRVMDDSPTASAAIIHLLFTFLRIYEWKKKIYREHAVCKTVKTQQTFNFIDLTTSLTLSYATYLKLGSLRKLFRIRFYRYFTGKYK